MAAAQTFTAVDISGSGTAVVDEFVAAHPQAAARRAQFAAEGVMLQLWTNGRLVGAWRRVGRHRFRARSGRVSAEPRPQDGGRRASSVRPLGVCPSRRMARRRPARLT